MAQDMFDLWRMVSLLRMEFSCWGLVPSPNLQMIEESNLRIFWSVLAKKSTSLVADVSGPPFARLPMTRGGWKAAPLANFFLPHSE